MKILKAPTPITVDIVTSAGTVKFDEGIATEFTEVQAAHFQNISKDYKVIELDDLEDESFDETTKDTKVKIALAESEEDQRKKKAEADEKAKENAEQDKAKKAKELEDEKKAEADRLKKDAEDKAEQAEKERSEKEANDKKDDEERQKKEDEKKAIKIPDESTPYPRLMDMIKKFKIPTPNGRNAEELLKVILADEHFKKSEMPE